MFYKANNYSYFTINKLAFPALITRKNYVHYHFFITNDRKKNSQMKILLFKFTSEIKTNFKGHLNNKFFKLTLMKY